MMRAQDIKTLYTPLIDTVNRIAERSLLTSLILIATMVLLASCSKDKADEPFKPVDRRTVLLLTEEGYIYNQNYEQVAQLPHCTYASQIISDGSDYFVSGTYENGNKVRVGYWKNGKWTTLHVDFIDDVDHWIYGIGKWDYYLYLLDHPNVLKNSGIFPIVNGGKFAPAAQALAVSQGKCYVVGGLQTDEDGFIFMPVICNERNGKFVPEFLPVPAGTEMGFCNCIYAYNVTHTIIGGNIDDRPVLWIDKQLNILPLTYLGTNSAYFGEVRSVTECSGHIYAVGDESKEGGDRVATLWLDNEIHHLVHSESTEWSTAVEVMSYGSDVYVVTLEYGTDEAGEAVASTVLWMNGEFVKFYPGLKTKSFTVI